MLTLCKPWVDECNGLAEAWELQFDIAEARAESDQSWQRYIESL